LHFINMVFKVFALLISLVAAWTNDERITR